MATTHACISCGEAFASSWEKATHWIAAHDGGYVAPGARRMKRSAQCWRCAREITAGASTCACGFTHPLINHVGNK